MGHQLIFYLKVSRPGLWFATIWLYLLPTGQMDAVWTSPAFWTGLLYCGFPLNFMVYGWNDRVDFETDQFNPRKDSFWFGACGSREQLRQLWKPVLLVQLVCWPLLIWYAGFEALWMLISLVIINVLYNLPDHGWRSRPPLDMVAQVGYLLIVPLSIQLNNAAPLPWTTYLYLALFSIQSHLMGEVMDYLPDQKAGRTTTATLIGVRATKLVIIGVVALEASLLFLRYHEMVFGGMLTLVLLWLVLDLLIVFRENTYTLWQMKLFAFGSNMLALASMIYVWRSGCLLETVPN